MRYSIISPRFRGDCAETVTLAEFRAACAELGWDVELAPATDGEPEYWNAADPQEVILRAEEEAIQGWLEAQRAP